MIYVYIWFEEIGWSTEPPFEEDLNSIDSGRLLVLQMTGDPPKEFGKGEIERCLIGSYEGNQYHYIP